MEMVLELTATEIPARIPGMIMCPLHDEDTPSLCIYEDHWHCYGCGLGGGPLEWVVKVGGTTRTRARTLIETGYGDDIQFAHATFTPREPIDLSEQFYSLTVPWTEEALVYIEETWPHLGLAQLNAWGVRCGRYQLLIPHCDAKGVICGIKTRTIMGGNRGRKLSVTGSTYPCLYKVSRHPEAPFAYLVEGESDTWTMQHSMAPYADTAIYGLPSGVNTWRPEYRDELLRHENICVATDNDEAGEAGARRIIDDLTGHGAKNVKRLRPAGSFKDWTEQFVAYAR